MDARRAGLHRSQYPNPDWDAAITLFGLSIPVVGRPASSAIATAASEVSTKLADDVRSNDDGIPCLPNKSLNIGASCFGSKSEKAKNGLQVMSSQHEKMEAQKVKNGLQAISSQHGKMESDSKSEEVETDSDGSDEEVVVKKPGPLLPCPRCNSIETKFCYYNNYNLNQPRHYCRGCQRYWTVGGRMRNVPVGSGRRSNKQKSMRLQAIKLLDDMRAHRSSAFKPPVLPGSAKENEAITTSGSEAMLCMSLSPVFSNSKEQKKNTDLVSSGSDDSKEEKSCLSSAVLSGSSEDSMAEKEPSDISGYGNVKEPPLHADSYPAAGPALVFPYSSGSNSASIMAYTQFSTDGTHGLENSEASLLSLLPQMMPAPGIHAPVVPFPSSGSNSAAMTAYTQFSTDGTHGLENSEVSLLLPAMMPAPGVDAPADPFPQVSVFWNFIPGWPNGACNEPWAGTGSSDTTTLPSLPPNFIACSGSDSLTLGKHPREVNSQEEEKAEKTFWVPKTLRVTNPDEAAKSSIWASLEIQPDWRLFRKRPLRNGKKPKPPQALLLQAGSQTVQERT